MTLGIVFAHGPPPVELVILLSQAGIPFILSGAILFGLIRDICRKVAFEEQSFSLVLGLPLLVLTLALFVWIVDDAGWTAVLVIPILCLLSAPFSVAIILLYTNSDGLWVILSIIGGILELVVLASLAS